MGEGVVGGESQGGVGGVGGLFLATELLEAEALERDAARLLRVELESLPGGENFRSKGSLYAQHKRAGRGKSRVRVTTPPQKIKVKRLLNK